MWPVTVKRRYQNETVLLPNNDAETAIWPIAPLE
jgi:hypothetical protein